MGRAHLDKEEVQETVAEKLFHQRNLHSRAHILVNAEQRQGEDVRVCRERCGPYGACMSDRVVDRRERAERRGRRDGESF